MKVVLQRVAYRLARPLATAFGRVEAREGYVLALHSDAGVGRGEATPLPGFSVESLEQVQRALEGLAPPAEVSSLEDVTAAASSVTPPSARHAVECALLEVLALMRGVPVARLLTESGDAPRDSVPVSALVEGEDAAALARAAAGAVAQGFSTIKVKVGVRPLAVEAQRLLEVRRAVGPSVRIRVDANGGWSEAQALSALRGFEALSLELCEQPVRAEDVGALYRLRRAAPMPVAADEALLIADGLDRILDHDPHPAASLLVLKPMALGGLLPALSAARRAQAAGVGVYATTLLDGPLARAAAAHLACVLGSDWAHGLGTVESLEGIAPCPLAPVKGVLTLRDAPGWGVP